ncbi:MAG: TatD family hydrolase, partial [Planctomycetes bacterium]|nr:TatD family hydrolase [Planctomycetota bacterium]
MIDTHCHLTSSQFASMLPDIIERAAAGGVQRMITVATDGDDAIAARELAHIDERIFFSSGIHPL